MNWGYKQIQILKTFTQGILKQDTGTYKLAAKTVVIGDYPTLTSYQLVYIVKEYEKNPEPGYYYFVYDETKQEVTNYDRDSKHFYPKENENELSDAVKAAKDFIVLIKNEQIKKREAKLNEDF